MTREHYSVPSKTCPIPSIPPLNDNGSLMFCTFNNAQCYNIYLYNLYRSRTKWEKLCPGPVAALSLHAQNSNGVSSDIFQRYTFNKVYISTVVSRKISTLKTHIPPPLKCYYVIYFEVYNTKIHKSNYYYSPWNLSNWVLSKIWMAICLKIHLNSKLNIFNIGT